MSETPVRDDYEWLVKRLRRLGCRGTQPDVILAHGISTSELEELVRDGCPLVTAVRILTPVYCEFDLEL